MDVWTTYWVINRSNHPFFTEHGAEAEHVRHPHRMDLSAGRPRRTRRSVGSWLPRRPARASAAVEPGAAAGAAA